MQRGDIGLEQNSEHGRMIGILYGAKERRKKQEGCLKEFIGVVLKLEKGARVEQIQGVGGEVKRGKGEGHYEVSV